MNPIFATWAVFVLSVAICHADPKFSGFSVPRLSDSKTIRMPTPEVMDFMKSADAVYTYPLKKARAIEYRLVDGEEKTGLLAIFLEPTNYYQGLQCIVEMPADFGIEFRKKDEKLDLICSGMLIEGSFRGRRLNGTLQSWGSNEFGAWCQKYRPAK